MALALRPFLWGTAVAIMASGLRFNGTRSMPIGLYRVVAPDALGIRRGALVAVCAPAAAAELGRRRGYLTRGQCAGDSEPLLKVVAAVAGDDLTVSSSGVFVNGCRLPSSAPRSTDR